MTNYDYESKRLHLEIKENADKYISGEKSLDEPLKRTEELYNQAFEAAKNSTANKFSYDSRLMQLQSKIVRQRAKSYKPDDLFFDPREFSEKLKRHFMGIVSNDDKNRRLSNKQYSIIWEKLGEESQKKMDIAPTFDFLYGTFNAEPASPVKKKRKRVEKDKLSTAVKPKTVDISENSEGQDVMITRAHKTLSILLRYIAKSEKESVCFYEFVIDPQSFSRTIENIFCVTLLLKNGDVCIINDDQGLPWLKTISEEDKSRNRLDPQKKVQSVLSMGVEEWQAIIRKCNFTRPLIPPPRSQPKAAEEK